MVVTSIIKNIVESLDLSIINRPSNNHENNNMKRNNNKNDVENNIARSSDIRLSRNVVNKESKSSRCFVCYCDTSSVDNLITILHQIPSRVYKTCKF